MPNEIVLVVEDEKDIQDLINYNLTEAGYHVECANTGEEGLTSVGSENPDLIVLDLMLPGLDGLAVCRSLKANPQTNHIPIIILTARGEEEDIIAGFAAGADDYVTKPFKAGALAARVAAVIRRRPRTSNEPKDEIHHHELTIHRGRHELMVGDRKIELTRTEFNILCFLASRPGWVFTRRQIVEAVHGADYPVTSRSVDVQVASVRRKLGQAGKYIETVRGIGYRMGE